MPFSAPSEQELRALLGSELYGLWEALLAAIEEKYEMDRLWNKGYRDWIYEYKYRRGGKTVHSVHYLLDPESEEEVL